MTKIRSSVLSVSNESANWSSYFFLIWHIFFWFLICKQRMFLTTSMLETFFAYNWVALEHSHYLLVWKHIFLTSMHKTCYNKENIIGQLVQQYKIIFPEASNVKVLSQWSLYLNSLNVMNWMILTTFSKDNIFWKLIIEDKS